MRCVRGDIHEGATGMSEFILVDHNMDNTKPFPTRSKAEEKKNDMLSLGAEPDDLEIVPPGENGNESATSAEVLAEETDKPEERFEPDEPVPDIEKQDEQSPEEGASSPSEPMMKDGQTPMQDTEQLPDEPPVDTDPLTWIPDAFQDTIEGTVAINRKGYEVLAHHYNISVETKVLVSPSENDHTYAEVVATATTEDGNKYSAHGSAHVDRDDDSFLLLEMADTRAAKRATARATGTGMIAVQELKNEL